MDIFSYENGLIAAFLAWFYSAVITLVNINSQLEKNLNKVGLRLSWITLGLKQMDAGEVNCPAYKRVTKYVFIYWISFPLILLSWFSAALYVGMVVYKKIRDSRKPAEVKGYLWRLSHLDMSFDEIVELIEKIKGADPGNLENAKSELRDSMRLRGLPVNDT